jgi:uncharacterized membrane protein YfhO
MENNKTLLIQDKETINKILASLYTDANFNLKFQKAVIDGVIKRAPKIINSDSQIKKGLSDIVDHLADSLKKEMFDDVWVQYGLSETYKRQVQKQIEPLLAEAKKNFKGQMEMTCLVINQRLDEISNEVKDAFTMNGQTINAENIIRKAVFDYMDSKFGNKKLD